MKQQITNDPDAAELFAKLEEKYGGVGKVAEVLDIPRRTYYDWRTRGFSTQRRWKKVKQELSRHLFV